MGTEMMASPPSVTSGQCQIHQWGWKKVCSNEAFSLHDLNNWNKSGISIMVKSSKLDGPWIDVWYILKPEAGDV